MRLIKINYGVMPDLIRHPEYIALSFLDSGFRRNDKSLRDNRKFISPKGEEFQPSPKETLKNDSIMCPTTQYPVISILGFVGSGHPDLD